MEKPDYIIPVEIEGSVCNIYVLKRPGVDEFLKRLSPFYEMVIYTASLSKVSLQFNNKYADPLMDELDVHRTCTARLFREHCTFYNGIFVKDLSRIQRKLKD